MGSEPRPVVVCGYNVENYLGEDQVAVGARRAKPKTEKQIAALVRVIREINPDVLGVCEMGSREQFAGFQARLNAVGLEYKYSEYVEGPDVDRHLALLSRFPIVARQSRPEVGFELEGVPQKVRRGFLDVTVEIRADYRLRLVGVHLKSKLAAPEGEALIRRQEAHLLRAHLEAILAAEPAVNLLCYGDFNDLKNEPLFQEISGVRGSSTYMADLWAKDAFGDRWTHYWRAADLYSRIDYFFVSPGLYPEVIREKSSVYRSSYWQEASDHRPVYATILPVER